MERLACGRLRRLLGRGALDALERVRVQVRLVRSRLVHATRGEARAVLADGLLGPRLLQPPSVQRRPVRWLHPLEQRAVVTVLGSLGEAGEMRR